jgi:hypothetical protein
MNQENILKDDICFVLYTSTKGHFGYKNCYRKTVENLEKLFGSNNHKKLCHIKISDRESDIAAEMTTWIEERGWRVINSYGSWSHNDKSKSHSKEYYKDKLKCFSHPLVYNSQFAMWIEDDEIISSKDFYSLLNEATSLLKKEKNVLCVRINRRENSSQDNSIKISDNIFLQKENYTQYGATVTFQPTIVRSLEWLHALRFINQNQIALDNIHCELLSGYFLSSFSDSKECFAFFDFDKIGTKHIGLKEEIDKFTNP